MKPNIDLKTTWQLIGTQYRPRLYSAMKEVCLGDTVNVLIHNSNYEGIITTITMRGVVISNVGMETTFVKWCNILSYKKNN